MGGGSLWIGAKKQAVGHHRSRLLYVTKYRLRGSGEDYDRFMEWIKPRSIVNQWTDFPWWGFEFKTHDDDVLCRLFWDEFIHYEADSTIIPPKVAKPRVKREEQALYDILANEIRKAVDEEVLASLKIGYK